MALDKLVDSSQLDSDLNSVANAILDKSGGTGPIAFPSGFVSEIQAIPSGGGVSIDDIATNSAPSGAIVITASTVAQQAFAYKPITSVSGPNVTSIGMNAFSNCTALTSVDFPSVVSVANYGLSATRLGSVFLPRVTSVGSYSFNNDKNLTVFVAPKLIQPGYFMFALNAAQACTALAAVDFEALIKIGNSGLRYCSSLSTLILRKSDSIVTLNSLNEFLNTPFASGGSGGTIYIPKALYDHLGDGSALDYKAATNWSTVNGYGTITWVQIEGSQYETAYADGTPIT